MHGDAAYKQIAFVPMQEAADRWLESDENESNRWSFSDFEEKLMSKVSQTTMGNAALEGNRDLYRDIDCAMHVEKEDMRQKIVQMGSTF